MLVQVLGEMWVAAADMNLTRLGDVGRVVLAAPTVHMSGLYRLVPQKVPSEGS